MTIKVANLSCIVNYNRFSWEKVHLHTVLPGHTMRKCYVHVQVSHFGGGEGGTNSLVHRKTHHCFVRQLFRKVNMVLHLLKCSPNAITILHLWKLEICN